MIKERGLIVLYDTVMKTIRPMAVCSRKILKGEA